MRFAAKAQWWLLLGLLLCLPLVAQAEAETIAVADLPPEARSTLQLIMQNGPFPYSRDGTVFNNYERMLPQQTRGYYHEYTVRTPGVEHRGARRIVCGPVPTRGRSKGSPLVPSDPFALTECYYTADHYRTFRRIREEDQ